MFLHKVEAQEYKGFKSIYIEFEKKFTIICGPNGVGKSTILFAVASALTLNNESIALNENSQCRIQFTTRDSDEEECGFGKGSYRMASLRKSIFNGGPRDYQYKDGATKRIYSHEKAESFSPLFIGPNRNIIYKQLQGMKLEKTYDENRKDYIRNAMSSLGSGYTPDIKQWMINRYFIIEKDWAKEERYNWDLIISNLDYIFGGDKRFSFEKIERELEPSFIVDNTVVYLEDLSSGFKSILSIVLSIVEWIEKTNDRDNMSIDKAKGIVLIDELDAHLHPSWQTSIRSVLRKVFPELQFIVTTHSPHIISSAEENEVLVLKKDDDGISFKKVEHSLAAWKTDDIYSLIMGVDTVHQQTLKSVVFKIEEFIGLGLYEEALKVIDNYAKTIPEYDPTALSLRARVNALIKNMEREKND
ncbi:AAA family ATPase [Citrobacter braakii]